MLRPIDDFVPEHLGPYVRASIRFILSYICDVGRYKINQGVDTDTRCPMDLQTMLISGSGSTGLRSYPPLKGVQIAYPALEQWVRRAQEVDHRTPPYGPEILLD